MKFRPFLILLQVQALAAGLLAADEPPVPAQPAVVPLHILSQKKVSSGNHFTVFNRVLPPVAPSSSQTVAPASEGTSKRQETLILGATVFDHQVTELRWSSSGQSFHAFSNIDFNELEGVGSFETADTIYTLFITLGNEIRDNAASSGQGTSSPSQGIPFAAQFPAGGSSYILDGATPATAENGLDLTALNALHTYYNANRESLQQAYQAREAARVARELWQKSHPQAPKDTVIQYWPKQSRTHLPNGGTRQP